jgi:plastocyanin
MRCLAASPYDSLSASNDAMLRATARTLAAGAVAAALLACGSSSTSPTPQPGTVTATTSLQFTPPSVTVTRSGGTATVTWVFQSTAHRVDWDSQPSGAAVANIGSTSSASVGRDFSVAGSYTYHCEIHPAMTGTVVVQ